MFIFKGVTAHVTLLTDDTFNVLSSLHSYMTKKLNDRDHSHYHNYKKTNRDYWGNGYTLLSQIVSLPKKERSKVNIILVKENEGTSYVIYYYKGKGYEFTLERKFKNLHKIMDRFNQIFEVEDSQGIKKQWKYLTFLLS